MNGRASPGSARFKCVARVTLLPYHGLGEAKYRRMGRTYRLNGLTTSARERMTELANTPARHGLLVTSR